MARFRIRNGQTRTTELTLNSGDSVFLEAMGQILGSNGAPAVGVAPGTNAFSIINRGVITVDDTSGTAIRGLNLGLDLDVSIRNAPPGLITSGERAIELTSPEGAVGTVRLSNAGTIQGGTSHAVDFDALHASSIVVLNEAGGRIANEGTNDVLRPGNDTATRITVINEGLILAVDTPDVSESGDAIDLRGRPGGVAATIVNRGEGIIEGGKHGVTGANGATINNGAGSVIIGRNGSGVNFDTDAADGDGEVVVRNYGLISGRYDGLGDGDGDGVDVDYLVDIRNFGRIEGRGADEVDDFADGVAAGGGYVFNGRGAVIAGATNGILIDDGDGNGASAATRVVNRGEIVGGRFGAAIRFVGDFDDSILNFGRISNTDIIFRQTASIDMGGGDDNLVNNGSIGSLVLLGDGQDTYSGTGTSASIYGGDGDDVMTGGASSDNFYGDAGDDILTGGTGNNLISGGVGADRLTGGAGFDNFYYRGAEESTLEAFDTITDYEEGDFLQLEEVDAITATEEDDAFTLVAEGAFTGQAGELILVAQDGGLFLYGDTDGDSLADFAVFFDDPIDPAILEISF